MQLVHDLRPKLFIPSCLLMFVGSVTHPGGHGLKKTEKHTNKILVFVHSRLNGLALLYIHRDVNVNKTEVIQELSKIKRKL